MTAVTLNSDCIKHVFTFCSGYEPVLRLVCKKWRNLSSTTQGNLTEIVRNKHNFLFEWICGGDTAARFTVEQLNAAARMAASVGNKELLLKYTTHNNTNISLAIAASNGHMDCIEVCLKKNSHIGGALRAAACNGQIEAMERLHKAMGGLPCRPGTFMRDAAKGGVAAMNLVKSWGDTDAEQALEGASHVGNIEGMHLARNWGARNLRQAMASAITGTSTEAMALLREWGSECSVFDVYERLLCVDGAVDVLVLVNQWGMPLDLNVCLKTSAMVGDTRSMTVLREWNATALEPALRAAARNNNLEAMHLLKEWGACGFDRAIQSIDKRGINRMCASTVSLLEEWKRSC